MLLIGDQEYFNAVKAKAVERGLLPEFQKHLDYLDGYACNEEDPDRCVVVLYRDFAPESFSIQWFMRNKDWTRGPGSVKDVKLHWDLYRGSHYKTGMNGGLIFYGAGDNGTSAPQFSVSLDTTGKSRWEVHT